MALLESVPETLLGIGVELFIFTIAATVVYRALAGRFLVPKRHTILPNQRGVIVRGENVVRVAGPGPVWIRPRQRVVLCDARPRPLQMVGFEIICADGGIMRISLSGEFHLVDAAIYYARSSSANDAFFAVVRRAVLTTARLQNSTMIAGSPAQFAELIRKSASPMVSELGLEFISLDIWEAIPLGFLNRTSAPDTEPKEDESKIVIH